MGKKSKPKRPTRDDFELEELANRLIEVMEEKTDVNLLVWNQEELVTGRVVELDSRTKLVHISKYGDIVKVPFLDIMKVSNA